MAPEKETKQIPQAVKIALFVVFLAIAIGVVMITKR